MRSFADFRIDVPLQTHGEYRTTCPECSPRRRKSQNKCLSVNVDKGTWFCHHCEWSGGLGGKDSYTPSEPPRPDERKREALRQVWAESLPAGDPKAQPLRDYIRNRGLSSLEALPKTIRFHPGLTYWHEGKAQDRFPAILCRVDSLGGNKAPVSEPKKLMSSPVSGAIRGAAIRLYPAADTLAVAEGVETALAVHIATNLPVWATISAGEMAALRLPENVSNVRIMADLDRSGAGELASRSLAKRLVQEGRDARIIKPKGPVPVDRKGLDWLDVLLGVAA